MRQWSLSFLIALGLFTGIGGQYNLEATARGAVTQEDAKEPSAAGDADKPSEANDDKPTASKAEQPKAEQPKAEQPKAEQLKAEQLKAEQLKAEQLKAEQLKAEQLKATPKPKKPLPKPAPLKAAALPEIPSQEDLRKEEVKDGLPATAKKILAAHHDALRELQKKYEDAPNEKAAAAVKHYLKSTKDRIKELEEAVQEYLKK
jgi:hypothetical protein